MPVAIDITGQRFGRFTVLSKGPHSPGSRPKTQWNCRCDCGNEKVVRTESLRSGHINSCGCSKIDDLTGKKFNRLTVVKQGPTKKKANSHSTKIYWECMCDCGNTAVVQAGSLRTGGTKSCGCHKREVDVAKIKAFRAENFTDLTGQTFGRLTVLGLGCDRVNRDGSKRTQWECRCSCGALHLASTYSLEQGSVSSCGCLRKDTAVQNFRNEGHETYSLDPSYAERPSWLYLVEVAGVVDKIGIAFDPDARAKLGDYTQTWWKKEMPRAQCWAVEQVALSLTSEWKPAKPYYGKKNQAGASEQRTGWVLDDVIQLLEQLCSECQALGWEQFYAKHLSKAAA